MARKEFGIWFERWGIIFQAIGFMEEGEGIWKETFCGHEVLRRVSNAIGEEEAKRFRNDRLGIPSCFKSFLLVTGWKVQGRVLAFRWNGDSYEEVWLSLDRPVKDWVRKGGPENDVLVLCRRPS
ncbi:MAG TPA: hypothetical protein VJB37_01080 [Patescibacteria group bacterium]|nr:hypothetical protein [Patescibacteria group bacterium]